jgi:glycosyltransferase involved in cell wall biosynthesis
VASNAVANNGADLVSVVVPTRNSERTIERCLRGIREQSHDAVELIVVDNHSEDASPAIAAAIADVVVEAGPERSAQRNIGAARARGSFLAFIDSDMTLERDVIAEAVAAARGGAAAVVIPEESVGDGFWSRCKALERSCYLHDETVEAARFFEREAFERVGGFDEAIMAGPEDWDIHERVRQTSSQVGRTQAIIRHDEGRLRLRETMATKFYYGRATAAYIRKHPRLARRQLRVVRPAFLRHWRELAKQPITTAGMLFMKVCELGAGAAGLAWSLVSDRGARS